MIKLRRAILKGTETISGEKIPFTILILESNGRIMVQAYDDHEEKWISKTLFVKQKIEVIKMKLAMQGGPDTADLFLEIIAALHNDGAELQKSEEKLCLSRAEDNDNTLRIEQ